MKKILKNKTLPKKKNLRVEKEVGNCLFSHLHKKNVGKNYQCENLKNTNKVQQGGNDKQQECIIKR